MIKYNYNFHFIISSVLSFFKIEAAVFYRTRKNSYQRSCIQKIWKLKKFWTRRIERYLFIETKSWNLEKENTLLNTLKSPLSWNLQPSSNAPTLLFRQNYQVSAPLRYTSSSTSIRRRCSQEFARNKRVMKRIGARPMRTLEWGEARIIPDEAGYGQSH